MNIAIIPARGGSKRIPKKNIRPFLGKPMLLWVLDTVISSNIFDRVIVSTDDIEIANLAKEAGAEVPFMRPSQLSDDFSDTSDVIAHAIDWLISQGKLDVKVVACIYPTAPFLNSDDLKRGIDMMSNGDWDYVISVTDFYAPIYRSFKRLENGGLEMIFPEYYDARTQDLPRAYHDAAQFYLAPPDSWLKKTKIFSSKSYGLCIPSWRAQDIDTEDDWRRAEYLGSLILTEKTN
jgi:pseudaminic acid cytidylyltransferase